MISKERLDGNWNQVAGAVREKYAQISGDDLERVRGNAEQLVGLIQRKTGASREKVEGFLDNCCRSADSMVNRVSESASAYAEKAGQAVRGQYERLSGDAQRGYEYSMQSMRERPLESVAIAFGVGILTGVAVGIVLSNRR